MGKMENNNYTVYILECSDGTLYTGITNNLSRRMKQHQDGTGAKYTRGRGPFVLRWTEEGLNKSQALSREREIKQMDRKRKMALIGRRKADETSKEF